MNRPAEDIPGKNSANDGWIDLLPKAELADNGRWIPECAYGALLGFGGGPNHIRSRLLLLCAPRGSYEVEIQFQLGPIPPETVLLLNLPVGDREVTFGCLPLKPRITGLAKIQGRARPLFKIQRE